MKPHFARIKFREKYSMLSLCKLNFPSQREYLKQGFKCDFCLAISSQKHLIYFCPEYDHFRENKDLDNDAEKIQFLVDVMKYRQEQDQVSAD